MKTLYLHVGSHKTGTSSIQRSLKLNEKLLKNNGLYFLSEHPDGTRSSGNSAKWFKADNDNEIYNSLASNRSASISDSKLQFLCNKLSQFNASVIVSSEYLSWLFSVDEIDKIRKILEPCFDSIKIIIYVRRQDKLIISHHQQSSKKAGLLSGAFYGNTLSAIPEKKEGFREYLDFDKKILQWENVFGKENIIVRSYDSSSLVGGDAVKDFFNIFDVPIEQFLQINQSGKLKNTKVGYLINATLGESELSRIIRKRITGTQKSLPSLSQAKEFYAQYRESNILLNKRYSISNRYPDIFDSDFSFYPELAEDVWTEETANTVIFDILFSLQSYAKLSHSDLVKASKLLRQFDVSLSEKFLVASKEII